MHCLFSRQNKFNKIINILFEDSQKRQGESEWTRCHCKEHEPLALALFPAPLQSCWALDAGVFCRGHGFEVEWERVKGRLWNNREGINVVTKLHPHKQTITKTWTRLFKIKCSV